MSEKAPGQYPLTPDEKAILQRRDQEKIEEALRRLEELAPTMGYVSVPTFEELELTPEQTKQFHYRSLIEKLPSIKYYLANRKDGEKVKVVIRARTDGCYFAEFFSTNNHGSNHDFSLHEIKGNMQIHLELEPTKAK